MEPRVAQTDPWSDHPSFESLCCAAGRTLCTIEVFDKVAQAIADCAFVTAELPVVLSLEMHW